MDHESSTRRIVDEGLRAIDERLRQVSDEQSVAVFNAADVAGIEGAPPQCNVEHRSDRFGRAASYERCLRGGGRTGDGA